MSLKLNSSGGGSVTLQEPVTASDLTVNLPATLGNTGNSMQVTSDASGNVGVGVTPSAWGSDTRALQIFNRTSLSDLQSTTQLTNNGHWNGSSWVYRETAAAGNYNISGNTHVWRIAPSGTAGNAISFTQAMTLDASGNLLVGTTSSSASGAGAELGASGYARFKRTSDASLILNRLSSTGTIVITQYNTSEVGTISTNGTSTAYNTTSDYRLKNTIAPMTGALAKVALLKPCTYKWNSDNSDSQGFIAHELQEVVPECVTGQKDAVDAEGKPVYQGIDTSFLVATVVAALQELKAELDTVKAELAVLKGTA
jgi:hypothetical protein